MFHTLFSFLEILQADAGGSPALVASGLSPAQATMGSEQIQIQAPNEKVGLIIGRGGETIKGLQMKSGAYIQVLIPQQLPEGDDSKERTVQVSNLVIKEVTDLAIAFPWGQHYFLDVA
nr:RNA-binding protein Nova-1 [Arachis hypogaea]